MRKGRPPIPNDMKRRHAVACRLTDAEQAECDARRGGLSAGEWLRLAAFNAPIPSPIPAVNRDLWIALSPVSNNLNQIARMLNSGDELACQIVELRIVVAELRRILIEGEAHSGGSDAV